MNWDAIGASAEIVGAFAVIVTLFYLARQISQSNRALEQSNQLAKANSIHNINGTFSEISSLIATDHELANIYLRATEGQSLTPTEDVRFCAYINMFVAAVENLAEQQAMQLGYSELDSESAVVLMAPQLEKLLTTEAGARWWKESGPALYVDVFRQRVDSAIREQAT